MNNATNENANPQIRGKSVGGRNALDSLPTGARTTGKQAAARSRLVRRLRIALPTLAVVLVVAFFLNTRSNEVDAAFLDDFKSISASTEELRMANPRFAGIDDRGKPFEITAQSALQNPQDRETVELEMPRAIQGSQDDETIVTANKGIYRSEPNILELSDGVLLEHDIGADTYILRSSAATVQIKDEVVVSDAGVGGEGPEGKALKADSMKAYRSEGRVVFEGNVSMRIFPKASKTNEDEASVTESSDLKEPK